MSVNTHHEASLDDPSTQISAWNASKYCAAVLPFADLGLQITSACSAGRSWLATSNDGEPQTNGYNTLKLLNSGAGLSFISLPSDLVAAVVQNSAEPPLAHPQRVPAPSTAPVAASAISDSQMGLCTTMDGTIFRFFPSAPPAKLQQVDWATSSIKLSPSGVRSVMVAAGKCAIMEPTSRSALQSPSCAEGFAAGMLVWQPSAML